MEHGRASCSNSELEAGALTGSDNHQKRERSVRPVPIEKTDRILPIRRVCWKFFLYWFFSSGFWVFKRRIRWSSERFRWNSSARVCSNWWSTIGSDRRWSRKLAKRESPRSWMLCSRVISKGIAGQNLG